MMKVYGIVGFPVGHSRSPDMHNRAFAALGLAATYVPFEVAPPQLAAAVSGLRALGIAGFNVTLPHKTSVIPLLDDIDAVARNIGAVNTVLRDGDRLTGTNTDAQGLCRALSAAQVVLTGARVTVLGAGGAARASVVGLAEAGVQSITVAARSRSRAEALVGELRVALAPVQLSASGLERADLEPAFGRTDLLVQATSATLDGGEAADRFAQQLPIEALPPSAVVTDLVYRPLQTALLRQAADRGHRTLDGLGMLLHQGALAFELWTGLRPPLRDMREALSQPTVPEHRDV